MTIAEQIRADMKAAMKEKQSDKVTALRSVMAAFMNELVATGGTPQSEVSDTVAETVIKRAVKQRKEALTQFKDAGRDDLADQEQAELNILENYMPEQLSFSEIEEIARAKKNELGVEDKTKMGVLVGAVMKATDGHADGNDVKQVVESLFD